jgi:L-threonylcarbamoyladenylate synthase
VIEQAVELLRRGRLVAFPTETVYGLGADATDAHAVARIFAAKGRPSTNPLICHVADESVARQYARRWPAHAAAIAQAFWPGPITLVLPKVNAIPDIVTAGRDTVGLRAPNHPLALELLRAFGKPIAGPSANRSNHISPTTAEHVRNELGDRVDLVLDGGPCAVGIESTVLDLSGDMPAILRPGGVSREQIEAVIGPVSVRHVVVNPNEAAVSPGQHARHYAPMTPAIRVEHLSARYPADVGLLALSGTDAPVQLLMPPDPAEYARRFYAALRQLDAMDLRLLVIELPPDTPAWAAVRDRIIRATTPA